MENLDNENNQAPDVDNPETVSEPDEKEIRHSQQMEWARKEVERVKMVAQYTAKAAADETALLELYEKDKKSAKEVLEYLVPGADLDKTVAKIKWETKPKDEVDVEAITAKVRLETKVEAMFDTLSDEQKELVQAEYDDLTEGKKLTIEKAKTYFEKAKKLAGIGEKEVEKVEKKSDKKDMSMYSTPTGGVKWSQKKEDKSAEYNAIVDRFFRP